MLQPLGAGPLTTVHKATIAIAVLGFLVYGVWELRNFQAAGDLGSALGAVAGFAGTVVTALYFRALLAQGARGR